MNKIIIASLFFIVLLGSTLVLFFLNQERDLGGILEEYGTVLSGVSDFEVTKSDTRGITAIRGEEVMRLKIFQDIQADAAEKYVTEQLALFGGLFEPQLPPYPEFLTKETGCADKFKPVKKSNQYGSYYLVYAGERFGYGICTEDLIHYKASLGFFYCPQKDTLFKIEYFIPKEGEFDVLITTGDSLACL